MTNAKTIHVSSVYKQNTPEGPELLTLRVSPPPVARPPHDFFSLNMCRAVSDAIIESGQNMRDEPRLVGNVGGLGLRQWRIASLDKVRQPAKLILTTGDQPVNFAHPIFERSEGPVIVYTSGAYLANLRAGRAALPADWALGYGDAATPAGHNSVVVVRPPRPEGSGPQNEEYETLPLPAITIAAPQAQGQGHGKGQPSLRGAIGYLHDLGLDTVSVEAGPSTSAELYTDSGLGSGSGSGEAEPVTDVIVLSVYQGHIADVNSAVIRPRPLGSGSGSGSEKPFVLSERFLEQHYERRADIATHLWRFQMYVRKAFADSLRVEDEEPVDVTGMIAPPVQR